MAVRLVVFDLDGTLLRGPTVCEVLAAPFGRSPEMAEFEQLTELDDIRTARETMHSWYGHMPSAVLREHLVNLRFAPGAFDACVQLRDAGITLAIASLTWGFAVEWVAHKLAIPHWLGTSVDADGVWSHCWPETKATWTKALAVKLEVARNEIAAIGDSAGDVHMLNQAGVSVFVGQDPPAGLERSVVHVPDGDLRAVAAILLAQ
jgi:phosphoserine phosphatase